MPLKMAPVTPHGSFTRKIILMYRTTLIVILMMIPTTSLLADEAPIAEWLARQSIPPERPMREVQDFIEPRIPTVPDVGTPEEWQKMADRLRKRTLDEIVFRGKATTWRDARTQIEWLDTIPGGEGYTLRQVRYEVLPGMWVPAILYEPDRLAEKVPVMLAVNGHDGKGKAADYKQVRCINLAKRGMRVLNVEWFGMGQLREPGFGHYAMNQLDLCGSSGLAPFYLAMSRGIDVLLSLPKSDPDRVAVSGLSGGGWQTIFISGLDERVTLSNPVAGYSSFRTRVRHLKDLGDSEQTPSDLATVVDYTHLTAMRAPRPTLLTFNSKDQCCFEAGYAMPPLIEASEPIFKLFGKGDSLRTHVNDDPGTHNFEKDNRQALYRMIGDFFFTGDDSYSAREIECAKEIKSAAMLNVPLPKDNQTFNTLAKELAKDLPLGDRPTSAELRKLVRWPDLGKLTYTGRDVTPSGDVTCELGNYSFGDHFTVPGVRIGTDTAKEVTIVLHDDGKKAAVDAVVAEQGMGRTVIATDLFYFGESKIQQRDFLFALLVAAIGERSLGIQASQLSGMARHQGKKVRVVAVGPRTSLIALVAAAADPEAFESLRLVNCRRSLKELFEENVTVNQQPEQFCFGLLERVDIATLVEMIGKDMVKLQTRTKTE